MKHPLRHWLAATFAIATLTVAQSARAAFEINIYSGPGNATLVDTIVDNGFFDSNNLVDNNISVSGDALKQLNTDLQGIPGENLTFTSLGATNNSGTVGPNGIATLDVNGRIEGTGSVRILVSANDFFNPTGSPKFLVSTASDTFGNVGGETRNFTSYYNKSNTLNAREVGTTTLVFAPTPGMLSTSGTAPTLTINPASTPFGLTNETTITLSGTGTPADLFTGKTTVAVPEPTSMALLLVGGSALAFHSRRRLKSAS